MNLNIGHSSLLASALCGEILLRRGMLSDNLRLEEGDSFEFRSSRTQQYQVFQRTIKKFIDDKLFVDNNHFLVSIEGVVFNRHDLMSEYRQTDWYETVLAMYSKKGSTFLRTSEVVFPVFCLIKIWIIASFIQIILETSAFTTSSGMTGLFFALRPLSL